jgi:hypothetical protein
MILDEFKCGQRKYRKVYELSETNGNFEQQSITHGRINETACPALWVNIKLHPEF